MRKMKEFTPKKNGYKVYNPTISRLKRSKFTLITERNVWKVMGDIKRFMKKPCIQLIGFDKLEGIGTPKYRVYYGGECYLHPLYKKNLPIDKSLRLAIGSKYYLSCVPISIGDRYKVMGNRLVILHKYNKYVSYTPWLRYVEFIHKDDIDPDEIKRNISASAIGAIFEDEYEYTHNCSPANAERFHQIQYQVESIIKSVFSVDYSVYPDEITKNINCDGKNIIFTFKPNLYIEEGYRGDYYSFSISNISGEEDKTLCDLYLTATNNVKDIKTTKSVFSIIEALFGSDGLYKDDSIMQDYGLDYDEDDDFAEDLVDWDYDNEDL